MPSLRPPTQTTRISSFLELSTHQIFNSQVVAHLKNYKPEIGRVHDRLGELAATDERLEAHLDALEVRADGGKGAEAELANPGPSSRRDVGHKPLPDGVLSVGVRCAGAWRVLGRR